MNDADWCLTGYADVFIDSKQDDESEERGCKVYVRRDGMCIDINLVDRRTGWVIAGFTMDPTDAQTMCDGIEDCIAGDDDEEGDE